MTDIGEKPSREIRQRVIEALKGTFDPEIPVNVYDLGLVYRIDVDEEGNVEVDMTMTAPGCPVAGMVIAMAEAAIREAVGPGRRVKVNLVWDPPWTPERVTPQGRERLREIYGYDVVGEWIKRAKRG